MTMPDPRDFPRLFAAAFGRADAAAIAALCLDDATCLSLSAGWAEGRAAIETLLAAEFAGLMARARLVTGKGTLRRIGPNAALIQQRFVVNGLVDADGHDLPRTAALLTALMVRADEGWQAVAVQFSPVEG